MRDAGKIALAIGAVGVAGVVIYAATRKAEAAPALPAALLMEEPEVAVEEIIDAEFRTSYVFWAGLANWQRVYTGWVNSWPAATDITFAWEIKNIGNVGAYFQVYAFDPGDWYYLDPGEKIQVYELYQTPAIPVTPGYQYCRITILGRRIDGTRVGAVWTSDEFEVIFT